MIILICTLFAIETSPLDTSPSFYQETKEHYAALPLIREQITLSIDEVTVSAPSDLFNMEIEEGMDQPWQLPQDIETYEQVVSYREKYQGMPLAQVPFKERLEMLAVFHSYDSPMAPIVAGSILLQSIGMNATMIDAVYRGGESDLVDQRDFISAALVKKFDVALLRSFLTEAYAAPLQARVRLHTLNMTRVERNLSPGEYKHFKRVLAFSYNMTWDNEGLERLASMAADQYQIGARNALIVAAKKWNTYRLPMIAIENIETFREDVIDAVDRDDIPRLYAILMQSGIDDALRNESSIVLIYASMKGRLEVVKALLMVPGIDVNMKNLYGDTALMLASETGHVEVVEVLLMVPGIEVNKQSPLGYTALMMASWEHHAHVLKVLLLFPGIDANLQDSKGKTALMVASLGDDLRIVDLLLLVPDIKVNLQDSKGNTAIIWASMRRSYRVVMTLLQFPDIDVDIQNNDGETAIDLADGSCKEAIIQKSKEHDDNAQGLPSRSEALLNA